MSIVLRTERLRRADYEPASRRVRTRHVEGSESAYGASRSVLFMKLEHGQQVLERSEMRRGRRNGSMHTVGVGWTAEKAWEKVARDTPIRRGVVWTV